ncbi:transcription initiation factor IIF, beta subunit domain-containing protein [Ditylenchus destructor]|nr:transcription initiation factor IIF, beta subunit domain-containing protein [Ditylenchus destructor]
MSNSKKRPASEIDKVVNCEKSGRGVWLVKVPRYLSEIWEQNAGNEVGKLVTGAGTTVFRSTTKLPVTAVQSQMPGLRLPSTSSSLGATKPGEKPKAKNSEIPDEHRFLIRDLNNQTMAVLLEDKSGLEEEAELRTGKLTVEGRVVKRAECQPPNSLAYMKMKIKQIEKVSQPKQLIQTMDKAVVKFKPTATHNEHLIKEKAKKDGAKTVRGDRDVVTQAIFSAFEKHQYYRLTDLQKLTSQPASFVKEILMDIANYNTTFPHKTMWELKPEYRNYNTRMVRFEVEMSSTSAGILHKMRLGRLLEWSHAKLDQTEIIRTPSYLLYTRAGHIPHLSWKLANKHLQFEQKPILQLTLSSILDQLDSAKNCKGGVREFFKLPTDSLTHLSIWDPLGERPFGFNVNAHCSIWIHGGRKNLSHTVMRNSINAVKPNSYSTLFDYDTSRDSLNKRLTKATTRSIEWIDSLCLPKYDGEFDETEPTPFVSLGGGFSAYHRQKVAKELCSRSAAVKQKTLQNSMRQK